MHNIEAKTILSAENNINLYRGCTHGCIYCDSRSDCYGMDHEFEDVAVKSNAIELLEDALRRKRRPCMINTGSMCDPYMHCEEKLALTRRALDVIDQYNCGVTVITKSDRVLRDIDLYEQINRHSRAIIQMTMTTADEDLCRIIEPNVCTTRRRYEVLKEFRRRRIPTVVRISPILPYINDTTENLNGILDYCFEAGVKGIINLGFSVTLRAGSREYFYRKLDEHFPGMKKRYIYHFGDSCDCISENSAALWKLFDNRCRNSGVMTAPAEIFSYLREYPVRNGQISFFD